MTDDEKDRALCEAHCNTAADEYFNARPQLDSDVNRRIFYAGHRKAWIERGEAVRLNAQADIEMLNAENDRLMKLVIELRAETVRLNAQAVPDTQEKDLLQAIQERDAADDYIDALLDEVLGTDRPEWSSTYGHADAIEQVREMMGALMKPCVDKAWGRFQSAQAAPAAPQPAPVEQTDARDAARWRYIAWHIGVAWNEQGFTSLVRIVSDKHREMLGDMVDRMMAGDWPEAAPQPAQPLDLGVMELAESVGLIGPASRADDLHEAIQRFHDLIVVNASIKAARHFADGLAQQPLTDEQIKRIMLDNGFTIKEGLTDLKPYVYAAARALIAAATGVKP